MPDEKKDKRQYMRLNTVFPVEFYIVDKESRNAISELYEGFTRNIGKGGMGVFAKTLKCKEGERLDLAPHNTKLKVIMNIPLDKQPVECFATVEWVERRPGPLIDTYYFGISYDFINELEYEKIMDYVQWLRAKPRLIVLGIIFLAICLVLSTVFLFKINMRKNVIKRELSASAAEGKRARAAKIQAENKKSAMETKLEASKRRQVAMQAAVEKLAEQKKALEEISKWKEGDNQDLQITIERLTEEKKILEEKINHEGESIEEEQYAKGETSEKAEDGAAEKFASRLKSEEPNYDKFSELILNERIQGLDAYLSGHRGSIYHAAALFALAELRYKYTDKALAEVNYDEVITLYPKSKYALYSSHRLDQLRRNYNYDYYTLRDFYDEYNLPELFDHRNIEPYIK